MTTQEQETIQALIDNTGAAGYLVSSLEETPMELFDSLSYDMDNDSLDHAAIGETLKKIAPLMEEAQGAINKLGPLLEELLELHNG